MTHPIKLNSLSDDLNNFIYGVSRRNFQNALELTKNGIALLKSFPAARDAVLEYFSMVFHDAVNVSVNQMDYESDASANASLESVSLIGPELCSLGQSWAPLIAPWCINLLVDIATEKSNLPTNTLQSSEPIRTLLDTTIQMLTYLDTEERAKCIDMMLGCRACSWAVGWVGRAEPALVAPRALALGADGARAVLAHLANHPPALLHVRAALLDLFNEAINSDKPEKKKEVIPYLLNLAAKSDIVLKALIQDIETTLNKETIDRVYAMYTTYRNTGAWESVGPDLLVSLMMKADVKCLLLLLSRATEDRDCTRFTEFLFQKLEYESMLPDKKIPLIDSAAEEIDLVREILLTGNQLEQYSMARILILVCSNLPSEFVNTISYLLQQSRSDLPLALLVRIISGTVNMHVPNDTPDLSNDTERYQQYVNTGVEYALRDSILSDTQIKNDFVMGDAGEQKSNLYHYCQNVCKILRWENTKRVSHLRSRPISKALEANLCKIAETLTENVSLLRVGKSYTMSSLPNMDTCRILAELINRADLGGDRRPPPSVEVLVKVVKAVVKYFFRCMHYKDLLHKISGVQTACRILRKICQHSKVARAIALREILETAMFREESIFGSRQVIANTLNTTKDWAEEDMLLHSNQKQGPITQLTQSRTAVFHAGVIGNGKSTKKTSDIVGDGNYLTANNEMLMGALLACMNGNSGIVEGATSISLLLVELISPDVMYNGLPWPDEDFTKQVNMERELYTCACVRSSAVCRSALRLCARSRPALCVASALLRASAAVALNKEKATHDRYSASKEVRREREALLELLGTMTLGQLLPHPLSHIMEMAPELTSSELVQVLRDCVWNYTRDHVPSPALFSCDSTGLHWRDPSTSKPPDSYTDTMKIIIQKRIAKLGHLYPIMFLNLEKNDN